MGRILSAKSLTVRISVVVFIALGVMAIYFTYNSYRAYLKTSEEHVLKQLDAIAKTTALQLDGNAHEYLSATYTQKDDIMSNDDDSVYQALHTVLKNVHDANHLNTDMYTLVWSDVGEYYEFIVVSGNSPYYRHSYMEFPRDLLDKYYDGGQLDKHKSENGTWLSAFEPIRNAKGDVVGVLMVDRKFNDFIRAAASKLTLDVGISLLILLAIGAFLFRFLRMVVKNEEEQKVELEIANRLMTSKNKAIQDSINYAKRIQDALMPSEDSIKGRFPESYVFFRGKDVVSGDFPWMFRLEDEKQILLATVDCTGHGVPGALLSIIGYFLLNDIIKSKGITKPSEVLEELHKGVVNALKQDVGEGGNDGMDIAMVKINLETNLVEFAGAHRPLVWIHNGEANEVKGDRLAIGGTHYQKRLDKLTFTNHEIAMSPGDAIHFFSDGFPDQIGGPNRRRLMNRTLRDFFVENHGLPMADVGSRLEDLFETWKGTEMQLDDVLVIGIRFS